MRCFWSSNALHRFTSNSAVVSCGRAAFSRAACRASITQLRLPTSTRVCATSAALSYPHASVSVQKAVDDISESSTLLPSLLVKPSKASFAAAQAIRMCIANRGIADGFFVLNSIRYAAYRQKSSALPFKMPGTTFSKPEFEAAALCFGPDVSPRLSAHALLHGLLRNGLSEPAFELAKLMMAEGVALRGATLNSIIRSLVSPPPNTGRLPFTSPSPRISLRSASDVLVLRPSLMADQRTRFALQLLFLARRYRQRRTDQMFKLFMAASLLNGELIIFSLLFGWTCRDWQAAYSLGSNLEAIPEDDDLQSSSQVVAARLRWNHLRAEAIFPHKDLLERSLSAIDVVLERDGESPTPTHDRLVALQALGNLAGLLDRRQIPFPEIASLLRTMYKCPRVNDEIWITGMGGCPERIKAHEYFHSVLSKLIHSLPTHPLPLRHPSVAPDAIVQNRRYDMLPPLEISGYNALLHYALRHRLSPALGDAVLSHMKEKRWEPIPQDTVTANILLRSGSLMRRDDIVSETLQSMGSLTFSCPIPPTPIALDEQAERQTKVGIPLAPPLPAPGRSELIVDHTRWGSKLGRMGTESIQVPELPSTADIYTLTSYISYLTSRGQPDKIVEVLFTVLPELNSKKYRTNSERKDDRWLGRHAVKSLLERAIVLGPVFFTAILNALAKFGHFALADRIWELAKKAEQCSWTRARVPSCTPWLLGPPAYTVMLKCYGILARRRRSWLLQLDPRTRISQRTAQNSAWAAFMYECQKLPSPLPQDEVLRLLRGFMGQAALDVFRRLVGLPAQYARLPRLREVFAIEDLPRPDARFFNAALHVFRPRTPPMRESWYRQQLRHATRVMDTHGVVPENNGWNEPLHEVAKEMVGAGYPLPPGLQYLFVGRLKSVDVPAAAPRPDRGPVAYRKDEHVSFMRYRLPTPKERGLPVSRSYLQLREIRAERWKKRRRTSR